MNNKNFLSISNIGQWYTSSVEIFFFVYLFMMMSLGRVFAICHIPIGGFKLYITEILIAFTLPYVLWNFRKLKFCSPGFLSLFALFVGLAFVHLFRGAWEKVSPFVLRDIVLFGYPILVVLAFLIGMKVQNLRKITIVFIAAAFFTILSCRGLLRLNEISGRGLEGIETVFAQMKLFNFGIYLGISLAFLLAFLDDFKKRWQKGLIYVYISLILYTFLVSGSRSLWISVAGCLGIMLCFQGKKFLWNFLKILPVFVLVCVFLYNIDFKLMGNRKSFEIIQAKVLATKYALSIFFKPRNEAQKELKKIMTKTESLFPEKVAEGQCSIKSDPRPDVPADKSKGMTYIKSKILQYDEVRGNRELKTGRFREELDSPWWRYMTWRDAILFGLEAPLWGKGFGVYPEYKNWDASILRSANSVIPAHNDFITIFFKMGFVGLFVYLLFQIQIVRNALKYVNKEDRFLNNFLIAVLASLIFWHSIAFFYDVIESPPTNVFLWVILGLIEASVFHLKPKPKSDS